jgi:hypothetical protein
VAPPGARGSIPDLRPTVEAVSLDLGETSAAGGTTFMVTLTLPDARNLERVVAGEALHAIHGHRLPAVVQRLQRPGECPSDWPGLLRALRVGLAQEGGALDPAMRLCAHAAWDGIDELDEHGLHEALVDGQAELDPADVARTKVACSPHIAQACSYQPTSAHEWQQWFLFDDLWASAHPALAASLLRYAADWDPFRARPGLRELEH